MSFNHNKNAVCIEVERLASKLFDGQQDEQSQVRLEELLAQDPTARDCFIDCVALHTLLGARHEAELDSSGNSGFEQLAQRLLGETDLPITKVAAPISPELLTRLVSPIVHRHNFLAWTTAVCLLCCIGLVWWYFKSGNQEYPPHSKYVAVLSKTVGSRWASDNPDGVPARLFAGQTLSLDEGYAELTFLSGCTFAMKGPAEIELVSPMVVRAIKGAVWARVGEDAKGFVVETPAGKVIDLGTEFGINVDSTMSTTDVVVFEGAVDLERIAAGTVILGSNDAEHRVNTTRLTSGEALRFEQSGTSRRIMTVSSEQYPMSARSPAIEFRPPLIGSVSDNIRDPSENMYYQIVRAGLYDDSRAYVDRIHEWNGIDASGIPEILRGADYVKCFNSDKWSAELEITLELIAPARLFVLFDERLPVPAWLSEKFSKTGYVIGVDEGYPAGHLAEQRNDFGAGKSIDTTYAIWQTDLFEPGIVKLGALPKCALEVSMYGIAAVPLETSTTPAKATELF